MDNSSTIENVKNALMSDSNIDLDKDQLEELEWILKSERPDAKEIDLLVMGDDEGSIPEELVDRFPKLNQFLDTLY